MNTLQYGLHRQSGNRQTKKRGKHDDRSRTRTAIGALERFPARAMMFWVFAGR